MRSDSWKNQAAPLCREHVAEGVAAAASHQASAAGTTAWHRPSWGPACPACCLTQIGSHRPFPPTLFHAGPKPGPKLPHQRAAVHPLLRRGGGAAERKGHAPGESGNGFSHGFEIIYDKASLYGLEWT